MDSDFLDSWSSIVTLFSFKVFSFDLFVFEISRCILLYNRSNPDMIFPPILVHLTLLTKQIKCQISNYSFILKSNEKQHVTKLSTNRVLGINRN